ncbi:SatD family protein [Flavobacterium sp. N3904]|uniref:SatD family protein n=1 Tax=Flavobacterium sp. N3904 TaxID=2986835 RepID=UPI002224663D|nr:SatD family protein [Flavobacterium sp. N3904]
MIAIITADIINSRKLTNQDTWITPLKKLLNTYGPTPKKWEIFRGDYFQIEIEDPNEALLVSLKIKALIKSINASEGQKKTTSIDVRMAIGLGTKEYSADRISESNGTAFINSGEKFEKLKKEKTTLAIQSSFPNFDYEMNLYLKLAVIQMDAWTVNSAALFNTLFEDPEKKQAEIGAILGIGQNSVSGRFKRAHVDEILELEKMYRFKLKGLTQ